jgi:disulfide bond formation protein DsbB
MKNAQALRLTYLLGFILIAVLLGGAVFLQAYEGMNPCPLCILQRMSMALLGIIFFIGVVFKLKKIGQLLLNMLGACAVVSGLVFSGRQVWLQFLPVTGLGDCGVSLQYLFKILSFKEAIEQVWHGGMECSQTGWEFLHLSLAAWSLMGFMILGLLVTLQLVHAVID